MTLRVAAYCRVSTDKTDQINSFEAQKTFFSEYINRADGWTPAKIYADEGITGTTACRRAGFLQMIADAQAGQLDLIITKEVSRFSRNILDAVAYTRTLKSYGVGVVFLNDGISTLEPDCELRLGIMASVAQEESRKTSQRVKWGQQRSMERGVVFGPSLLGYTVKNGRITVEPIGAQTVRLIYSLYVDENMGARAIAAELKRRGAYTGTGRTEWSAATVLKILKNEKYCGDLIQRKSFTPDYLTHKKCVNRDDDSLVKITGHHEAIISKPLWEAAQAERRRRSQKTSEPLGHGSRYPLSGKIACDACGRVFTCRTRKNAGRTTYRTWCGGCTDCFGHRLYICEDLLCACVRKIVRDIRQAVTLCDFEALQTRLEDEQTALKLSLRRELSGLETKKLRLADYYLSGEIGRDEYRTLKPRYDEALRQIKEKLQNTEDGSAQTDYSDIRRYIREVVDGCGRDTDFYLELVESITIVGTHSLEISLKNINGRFLVTLENGDRTIRQDENMLCF